LSLQKGKKFSEDTPTLPQNGREYTPTSNIFGRLINDIDNFAIYKSIFDQHYQKGLSESEFIKLYKSHLKDGLDLWIRELENCDIAKGEHISILLKPIKKGLNLRSNTTHISTNVKKSDVKEFQELLSFEIGKSENDEPIVIKINDLREFDNRNIAIAGMAGSGKTQLIKDIL